MEDALKKIRNLMVHEEKGRDKAVPYIRQIENELSFLVNQMRGTEKDKTMSYLVVDGDEDLYFIYDFKDQPNLEGFVFKRIEKGKKVFELVSAEKGPKFWMAIQKIIEWVPLLAQEFLNEAKKKEQLLKKLEDMVGVIKGTYEAKEVS